MSEPWFKECFGPDYLEIYPHRGDSEADRQLPAIREWLDLGGQGWILDLACGAGRHTARLREGAIRCIGMDLSPALLDRARTSFPGEAPPLVQGDMRNLPFPDRAFDGLVNLFTSFGYFETLEENRRVLEEMHRVLRPGGRVVLDYLNPDRVVRTLIPRSERRQGDLEIIETRRHDPERSRVEKTIAVTRRDGPPSSTRTFRESVGLFSLRQMRRFFEEAGMTVVGVQGDFDASPYRSDSPRMILIGRREA